MKRSLIFAGLVLMSQAAVADISVQYNGQSIAFPDAKPKMTGGRVLVPLRAVLQGMGVDVKFDPALSLITASQGSTIVKLTLGSRDASVNDRLVTLDVPAQTVNGRTYVPLRFFGEAFGADVKWRSFDETVLIERELNTGSGNAGSGSTTNTTPKTFWLNHNGQNWMKGGQSVIFELMASPGEKAVLVLGDGAIEVPFREVEPGRYEAEYAIPMAKQKQISFRDEDPYAVVGTGSQRVAIKSTKVIAIDNDNPNISNLKPERLTKTLQLRPVISADLSDGAGSGVNERNVKLWLNGEDVSKDSYLTNKLIVFRPDKNLPLGKNEVKVEVADNAGNVSTVETEFMVVAGSELVTDFKSNSLSGLEPGDTIEFSAKINQTVESVKIRLGDQSEIRNATLAQDGMLKFSYTVRKGDSFDDSDIHMILKLENGEIVEYVPESKLSVAGISVPQPTITSPVKDSKLGSSVIFEGVAEKASKVMIRVQYVSRIFGLLQTQGLIGEFEVDVDKDGRFKTEQIALRGPLGSSVEEYVVTIVSMTSKGRESEVVTLTYKG